MDDFEDLMEFRQLEDLEIENYLDKENIEFKKLSTEQLLFENPSLKDKVIKTFEHVIRRAKELSKNPRSLLTFYTLE